MKSLSPTLGVSSPLSHHACGEWIEMMLSMALPMLPMSHHACGEWIEIANPDIMSVSYMSHHACGEWIEMAVRV